MQKTPMSFFEQVYQLVKQIPAGKVTTYGALAAALGTRDARRVGQALHANRDTGEVPCHRVVMADGRLAPGYAFGGAEVQRRRLGLEGVEVQDNKVDLSRYLQL